MRRALTLLYRQCADVINNEEGHFASYDFESWCELSQLTSLEKQPGEDYIRAVGFELQVPRIVTVDAIRSHAGADGPVQPQEPVCPR